jgi:hypothetical protein
MGFNINCLKIPATGCKDGDAMILFVPPAAGEDLAVSHGLHKS